MKDFVKIAGSVVGLLTVYAIVIPPFLWVLGKWAEYWR
jgi:hypothetical protein